MSAPNSTYNYYVRREVGVYLQEDFPMSANEAIYTTNNLRHLHDVATQHRVNWMGAVDGDPNNIGKSLGTTFQHMATFAFPWTFDMYGYPATPCFRVIGHCADSATQFIVQGYMNPVAQAGGYDADSVSYAFKTTGYTTNLPHDKAQSMLNVTENGHSSMTSSHRGLSKTSLYLQQVTEHDSSTQNAEIYLFRFSIYGKVASGTQSCYLDGVSVRETVYR